MLRLAVSNSLVKIDAGSEPTFGRKTIVEAKKPDIDFVTLASMTEGYSASDLIDLVGSATQQAMMRSAQSGDDQVSCLIEAYRDLQADSTRSSVCRTS